MYSKQPYMLSYANLRCIVPGMHSISCTHARRTYATAYIQLDANLCVCAQLIGINPPAGPLSDQAQRAQKIG